MISKKYPEEHTTSRQALNDDPLKTFQRRPIILEPNRTTNQSNTALEVVYRMVSHHISLYASLQVFKKAMSYDRPSKKP